MLWLMVILFLLVLGYGFFECGRYIAAFRNPNTDLPYPRQRLSRRLLIAGLVQLEILFIAARLFWLKGPMSLSFITVYTGVLIGIVLMVFLLLFRDLRDVRRDIRDARTRFKRELIEEISDLCSHPSDGKSEPDRNP